MSSANWRVTVSRPDADTPTTIDGVPVPYWRLVLRGCSQLCFQSNELTGAMLLLAVVVYSPIGAAYMLVAATLAPGARMLMGDRGPAVQAGIPGLNPILIALSLPTFFHVTWADPGMWGVLSVSVACTVVVTRVCVAVLPLPTLVLPFLLVFWGLSALEPHLSVLQPAAVISTGPRAAEPVTGVLSSLGEVAFSPNPWSGLLFLGGVLVSSRRHAVIALVGAAVAAAVAYYHGDVSKASEFNGGLFGFNGVLTALASFVLCGSKLRLAILGALAATMITPALSELGIVALSAPFVLATWMVLLLGQVESSSLFRPPENEALDGVEPSPDAPSSSSP